MYNIILWIESPVCRFYVMMMNFKMLALEKKRDKFVIYAYSVFVEGAGVTVLQYKSSYISNSFSFSLLVIERKASSSFSVFHGKLYLSFPHHHHQKVLGVRKAEASPSALIHSLLLMT